MFMAAPSSGKENANLVFPVFAVWKRLVAGTGVSLAIVELSRIFFSHGWLAEWWNLKKNSGEEVKREGILSSIRS
jgi:hypothetical protein